MSYFTRVEIKNCRRFIKYCYTTSKPIELALLNNLSEFGFVEIKKLSAYAVQFKDIFQIIFIDEYEIAGTIGDYQLYLTVNKHSITIVDKLEKTLMDWCRQKRNSGEQLKYEWQIKGGE